ncbi:MAG: PLP-dependent aminotransferase family protein, partial [Candidatus Competibacteraceae bacterium]
MTDQIYEALRNRVVSGHFLAGDCLPPSRKLAEELGVSRTTVVTAYEQLIAEGFAQGRVGSGIYISQIGEIERLATPDTLLPEIPGGATNSPMPRPFLHGCPDPRLFPYRQWAKCVTRVARNNPEALVSTDEVFGDSALRKEICRYLKDWRGLSVNYRQVVITAGAMDALELCVRTLTSANQGLLLEDPGYPPLHAFAVGLNIPVTCLKIDPQGAEPPEASTHATPLTVLTPSSQFPLGGAMPLARRNAFLAWASENDAWLVEDDYDSEYRYAGRPIPALAGLDKQERTLYVGSFSKVFSNGLRIGFVVLPPGLITRFSASLRRFGSKVSALPQRPLALFMRGGEYYRHIRRARRIYAERRKTLIDLLHIHLGDLASFVDHRAGMQIAVKLPDQIKDTEVSKAAARKGIECAA